MPILDGSSERGPRVKEAITGCGYGDGRLNGSGGGGGSGNGDYNEAELSFLNLRRR